jgi:phosphatidate cytidylyltransferase
MLKWNFISSTPLRVISAAGAIVLLSIVTYFWKTKGLVLLSCLAALKMQVEYARLTVVPKFGWRYGAFLVLCCFSLLLIALFSQGFLAIALGLLGVLLFTLLVIGVQKPEELPDVVKTAGMFAAGLFYSGILPFMIIGLLFFERGLYWFATILAIVFAGDIAAYFVGRKFKGPKISPAISPHKTWSGAYGGLVASGLMGLVLAFVWFPEIAPWALAAVSLIAGSLAQVGDFFESALKRSAGVKDSVTIMPGHGGMLDRLDGVLFAAPVIYLFASSVQPPL